MAQILIRGLTEETVKRLKDRARRAGRSLQGEVKQVLEREAKKYSIEEALDRAEQIRRQFAGREFPNSVDLIREDRDR